MTGHVAELSETRQERILRELLQHRGFKPDDYAFFFTTGEGRFLPAGWEDVEELSGYIVTRSGEHYLFWLGWDVDKAAPALTRWQWVKPVDRWLKTKEYWEALTDVGLSPD